MKQESSKAKLEKTLRNYDLSPCLGFQTDREDSDRRRPMKCFTKQDILEQVAWLEKKIFCGCYGDWKVDSGRSWVPCGDGGQGDSSGGFNG